ncbi:MAG: hypothetical protein AMXMBFR7_35800 [Planctomycetota bacterium]
MLLEWTHPIAAGFFQSDHATRRPPLDTSRHAALIYVTTGEGFWQVGAWTFPIRRGDFFAVPEGCELAPRLKLGGLLGFYYAHFELDLRERARGLTLKWPWDLSDDVPKPTEPAEAPVAGGEFQPEIAALFRQLQHELGRRLPAARAAARAQLTLLGVAYARQIVAAARSKEETDAHAPVRPKHSARSGRALPESVAKTIDYVHDHLDRELKLTELARVAGFSERRLIQVFRKLLGRSPMAFVREQRIREAQRLLSQRGITIKDVAARLNFADAHHFSRVFRQVTGISPSDFVRGLPLRKNPQSGHVAVSRPDTQPKRESNRISNRQPRPSGRFNAAL